MKRILFPFLALLIVLSSCTRSNKKAFNFNQQLVGVSEKLQEKGTGIGRELKEAVNTKDFSAFADSSQALLDYIDKCLADYKNMKDVSGSENLRAAMIDFLNFEKDVVSQTYIPLGKMNSTTSEEELQATINTMLEKSREEGSYLVKVQDAQREYASKNGFKMEAPPQN